ncbi:MAG: (Fe-S)-binding protein, partial [Syntrophobacteraceae bacterium]|nr:(Fe-S)-binding protein [Syntrophobacteraceae bacterium]
SLWEVLDQLGIPPAVSNCSGRPPLAVHDACTTRYETHIQQSVRHILDRLGVGVEELSLSGTRTECCGYGGLMSFVNPELAKAVIQRRISESPLDYVAYCAVCRDFLASRGKRTVHLLDLIFGSNFDQSANRPSPGYSQRHEHRARLKRRLLHDLWGEQLPESEDIAPIQLSIPGAVREIMENRLILEEDLRQVIGHAETSGIKLLNPETGRFLAHFKPASVTYWVEYSVDGDTFIIHNTYSHRMEIVEEFKP